MRCPTLSELPQPPSGRSGWPHTDESPQLPDSAPNGKPWPKISIVTPSYNQGQFIEETMRSVLLQGYPNLEYIIIDGGSGDESLRIIREYENTLAYWVSEPDRGQAHAINKGFQRATGEIFGWINSDDFYYPGVFEVMARAFEEHPEIALVHGYEHHVDISGNIMRDVFPVLKDARAATLYVGKPLLQLTCFWRSRAHRAVGGLDETLKNHMDYDFLLKLSYYYPSTYIPFRVGAFRRYPDQQSQMIEQWFSEHRKVRKRFLAQLNISPVRYYGLCCWYRGLALWRDRRSSGLVRTLANQLRCKATLTRGNQPQG